MAIKRNILIVTTALASATVLPGAACAQTSASSSSTDASASAQAPREAEIVVTARRRAESLQDVPTSVVAIGAETIRDIGAVRVSDVFAKIPNIGLAGANIGAFNVINVRGVPSYGRNIGFDTGLGFFIDGAFTGRQNTYNRVLPELERVETTFGPQGTLYGKNTTLGVVNLVTRRPGDELTGRIQVGVGNLNLKEGYASVSGPIGGNWSAGLTVSGRSRAGYLFNATYGGERTQGIDAIGYFGQLRGRFDGFELYLTVDGYKESDNGAFATLTAIAAGAPAARINVPVQRPRVALDDFLSSQQTRESGYILHADFDVGAMKLSSISTYRTSRSRLTFDQDRRATAAVTLNPWTEDQKIFSQELRLSSPSEQPFSYSLGAFYAHQDLGQFRRADFLQIPTSILEGADFKVNTYSLFAQGTLEIAPGLTLDAGLRWVKEDKERTNTFQSSPAVFLSFTVPDDRISSSTFSPEATLRYELSTNLMVYGRFARGYKSGGFNADLVTGALRGTTPAQQIANYLADNRFEDERTDNYEIGFKSELFDRRLRLNVSAFNMEFKDYQAFQLTIPPGASLPVSIISNAAKARSRGFELDGALNLGDFVVNFGAGYADAKFIDWPGGLRDAAGNPRNGAGNRLGGPKWTANVGAQYTIAVGDSETLKLRGDYSYRSSQFIDPQNLPFQLTDKLDSLDLRAEYQLKSGWSAAAWVRNLLDKDYRVWSNADVLNNVYQVSAWNAPRTFGVDFSYRF